MQGFLDSQFAQVWGESALTTLGFFWMALWAFCLGYTISSMIQVFVTRERMRRSMGQAGPRSVALGTFFGFISSSCSFAALSTTRALFQKGAGLVPALAFLLASTNLVIELGILIALFLSWHFVVGEYLGGILLIAIVWLLAKIFIPKSLIESAREHAKKAAEDSESSDPPDWKKLIKTREGWTKVSHRYGMEWGMVWKDVLFGFTVAGVIAAAVPPEFFQTLFVGSGTEDGAAWWQIALHALIGPVAAFFTFIGSMGNIPLAAVLFGSGVSFAGVMAFIFSDLVVFPVLRITAKYFGKKMAFAILGILLVALVSTALLLHAGFGLFGLLPDSSVASASQTDPAERFSINYTLFLNAAFLLLTGFFAWLAFHTKGSKADSDANASNGHTSSNAKTDDTGNDHNTNDPEHDKQNQGESDSGPGLMTYATRTISVLCILWLILGAAVYFLSQ